MPELDAIPFDQLSKWNAKFEAELVDAIMATNAVWGFDFERRRCRKRFWLMQEGRGGVDGRSPTSRVTPEGAEVIKQVGVGGLGCLVSDGIGAGSLGVPAEVRLPPGGDDVIWL